ncbi:MAG TPA: hypothetical protein VKQ08_08590, partial [Cyclobacteriaceae bacterium]|nr:hypothetical protein [Cyclobacteriaceae bacterium]
LQEIKDLKRDGTSDTDFFKDDLKLWDYKRWADQSLDIIQKEIMPMRDNLVAYDIEVNKLREKIRKDSVSVKNDLTKLVDKMLSAQLKKYDPDPLPLQLFAMKMAELEYHSDLLLNTPIRDSSNVKLKLGAIRVEINDLKRLDSIAARLARRDYAQEDKNYHDFISKVFGTATVLKSTVTTTQEYAKREALKKEKEWEATSQLLKWIVSASDSIPLFIESNRDLKFKPLVIEDEKYTFGLAYQDTVAAGYFYTITPSRQVGLKVNFPADKANFKKSNFSLFKGLSCTDGSGNAYIVMVSSSQKVKDKFPSTIAKIYRADGLAWSTNFGFDMIPSEMTLNNDSGDISVKVTDGTGEAKIVTFDKNGKQKTN